MTSKVTPLQNPLFIPDEPELQVKGYHSKVFRIQEGDQNMDNKRYQEFMLRLSNMDEDSNIVLSPIVSSPISKSWTKEGDLLIHVEYIELEEIPRDSDPDKRKY